MNQATVALVAFAVNTAAFWAMIIIIILGVGNQLYAAIAGAATLGLSVALYFMATSGSGSASAETTMR